MRPPLFTLEDVRRDPDDEEPLDLPPDEKPPPLPPPPPLRLKREGVESEYTEEKASGIARAWMVVKRVRRK